MSAAITATAYAPCHTGIHVCGINGDETEFVTVANWPRASRALFEWARTTFAVTEPDLVVDWVVQGDINEDFGIRRQDLATIERAFAREVAA